MHLRRVLIQNFRSIREAVIEFQPRCRILVGVNEAGKSNVLRALALLDPASPISANDQRVPTASEGPVSHSRVQFIFALDDAERAAAMALVSEGILARDLDAPVLSRGGHVYSLRAIFGTEFDAVYDVDVQRGLRVGGAAALEGAAVVDGWLVAGPDCPAETAVNDDGEVRRVSTLHAFRRSAVSGHPPELFQILTIGRLNGLISAAIGRVVEDCLPACVYWSYSERHLLPSQIHLDDFAANPQMCEPLRQMFVLAGHRDIAAALKQAASTPRGLRILLTRVADKTTEYVHRAWKEYKNIRIQLDPNGELIDVSIKDGSNLFDLASRSEGFKRFITFLLLVSTRVNARELADAVLLYDEPEMSLHPTAVRYLLEELLHISRTNHVVFTTHSIFMVDRNALHRHIVVRKEDEVTRLDCGEHSDDLDEEILYNALGYSVFESLRAANLLFEGWTDKRLFDVAVHSLPDGELKGQLTALGTCHVRGLKDIGRLAPLLDLTNRRWCVVSDGDAVARSFQQQQRQSSRTSTWYRYDEFVPGVVTAEDFVVPSAFAPVVAAIREEHPTLREFSLDGNPFNKEAQIKQWLLEGRVSNIKTQVDRVKRAVFENLSAEHIEARYRTVLSALAAKLAIDEAS
jgi:predicted ATPase